MSVVRKKQSVTKIPYIEQSEQPVVNPLRKKQLVIRRLSAFAVFVVIVSYFLISSLMRQSAVLDEMKEEKKQLDIELASLKKKEMILKEEIVKLNDEEYIAKLARRDFFLSNSNEIIFNLPTEKKKKEKSTE